MNKDSKQIWYFYTTDLNNYKTFIGINKCINPERTKLYKKIMFLLNTDANIKAAGYKLNNDKF